MHNLEPLELLLSQRKEHWLMHCQFVLENLLIPLCRGEHIKATIPFQRAIVLIENRIDRQWLFTVLNTWLMCPKDSEFIMIADKDSVAKARGLLNCYVPGLEASIIDAAEIVPGVELTVQASFNSMLKQPEFWRYMPHEHLLVIQTDALLAKPIHPFFFNFSYLGAPFLPKQHTEYFTLRDVEGDICQFFKTDSPIHGSPDRDVYPHLHGNGGLSIRSKIAMQTICEYWGKCSPNSEAEDVFFSRHISKVSTPAPLEISQAFATETTYNPNAIGSHACWKFLDGADLAHHFEQHLREAWAMTKALGLNQVGKSTSEQPPKAG